jgi:hypothetical protein
MVFSLKASSELARLGTERIAQILFIRSFAELVMVLCASIELTLGEMPSLWPKLAP